MAPGEGTHERAPQAGGPGTDNVLDTQLQRKERIPPGLVISRPPGWKMFPAVQLDTWAFGVLCKSSLRIRLEKRHILNVNPNDSIAVVKRKFKKSGNFRITARYFSLLVKHFIALCMT